MPTFDLDIDVDEFMDELSKSEISDVKEWLKYNGYSITDETPANELLQDDISKINQHYWRLSIEDIEIIKKIADKL